MGSILAVGVVAGTIIVAVLRAVLADEIKAWLPWIGERMIGRAVRNLPESQRERYKEEWHSHLNEIPGKIGQLVSAIGFLAASWKMSKSLNGSTSQSSGDPKSAKPGPPVSLQIVFGKPIPKDDI
jgi:hypothetical protein